MKLLNIALSVAAMGFITQLAMADTPTVWCDDALPAGATGVADGGDSWNWISANPAPYSGSLAHQSAIATGLHEHYFNWATPLIVGTNDTLFTYVYLDPANPPSELMLSWNDSSGSWEHRAYWGADNINYGTGGTAGRYPMGALPAVGQWVALQVPASAVGLQGATLQGMDFALYGGRATWDYSGKSASGTTGSTNTSGSGTNSTTGSTNTTGTTSTGGTITNSPSGTSPIDYVTLDLPQVGDSTLNILSPTVLELHMINTKEPDPAVFTSLNFVDANFNLTTPAISDFVVTVGGVPNVVKSVGFKRRPLYAGFNSYDLRVDNTIYLQLATPIADNKSVTVVNAGGALWSSAVVFTTTSNPLRYSPAIHVNQEGYLPAYPKKAMLGYYLGSMGELPITASTFELVETKSGSVVYQGNLTARPDKGYNYAPTPYQMVYQADFSSFTNTGSYYLVVPGLGASLPFLIHPGIAMEFARAYELGLYEQRSGMAVTMPYTRFTHAADHTTPASVIMPASNYGFSWTTISNYALQLNADNPAQIAPALTGPSKLLFPFINQGPANVTGGHFDAGDYSKYMIDSASTVHYLMFAVDSLPGVASLDNLGIPESGDGISDVLQEAKWEADFIAKMQDADGGFYFLAYPQNREYEGNVLPENGDAQVVWPKNSSATAAAVAALAQCGSSPAFKRAYPTVASNYLAEAKLGWKFLTNGVAKYGKNGIYQKITHYGDDFADNDEMAWAASEMFVATGDPKIQQTLESWFPDPTSTATFRWGWWRMYACYGNAVRDYAFAVRSGRLTASQMDAAYLAKCVATVTNAGNDTLTWSREGAYGSSFPDATKNVRGAGWYFSSDEAFDLTVAYQLNPDPNYLDALIANMNYEGGCNPVNASYITGLGWKRQRNIVDQYSENDGRVMPKSGVPIGNIQQGFIWDNTYLSSLTEISYPGDNATTAPYPYYDRWCDEHNVTTEMTELNQSRSLASISWLAAQTGYATQPWTYATAQITGLPAETSVAGQATASLQVAGMDLTGARIVWEAQGGMTTYGPTMTFTPAAYGTNWIEAEAYWPDGRRVFARSTFFATNNLPVVDVVATVPYAIIGSANTAVFNFTRSGSTASALTVNYNLAGSAVKWDDYRTPAGDMPASVTIPAGASSAQVQIVAKGNETAANPETVLLSLTASPTYDVGSPNTATVNLVTNAPVIASTSVSVAATSPNASRVGPVDGMFTLTRTGSTASALTVNYTTGGTAENGADYSALSGSLTIPAGAISAVVPVVPATMAAPVEAKSVVLSVTATSAYTVAGAGVESITLAGNSLPTAMKIVSNGAHLTWTSVPGKTYVVAGKSDLLSPGWTALSGNLTTSGTTSSWTDTSARGVSQRFYVVYVVN